MRRFLPFIIALSLLLGSALCPVESDARRRKPARREAPAPAKKKQAQKKNAPRTAGDVRREKKKTAGEIERTQKDIAANARQTRRQLNRLGVLDNEIKSSTAKVGDLQARVNVISLKVKELSDTVDRTQQKVDRLRDSYSRNLTAMRRQRQGVSDIAFIFSAGSFSGMMSRVRYLRELSLAQSARTRELKAQLDTLRLRRLRLDSLRADLAGTLAAQKAENARLRNSRTSASLLVDSLRREGSSLKKVLSEKQALARRLDAELDRIIAEEARRAAEEEARRQKAAEEAARKKAEEEKKKAKKSEQSEQSEIDQRSLAKQEKSERSERSEKPATPVSPLSGGFAANKGMLPAPVDRPYTISSAFGRNSHADLSRIEIRNNGIDLRTSQGASARAVFRGTVSSIFRLDGYNNIVILRHGSYLTVYAGIGELKVRKGQEVLAGQLLGTLVPDPDDDNHPTLHFEIRHEKTKLNPAEWLR